MTDWDSKSVLEDSGPQKFPKRENQKNRKSQKSQNLSELLSFKIQTQQPAEGKKKKERKGKKPNKTENLDWNSGWVSLNGEVEPEPEKVQRPVKPVKAKKKQEEVLVESVLPILEEINGTWKLVSSENVAEYLRGADEFSHQKWLKGHVRFTSDGDKQLSWCFVHNGTVHDLHTIELGKFKNGEKWGVEKNHLLTSGDYPAERFIANGKLYCLHSTPMIGVSRVTCKLVYERIIAEAV